MKSVFCVLAVFFCASASAQTFSSEESAITVFAESVYAKEAVSVILREKKCLVGKERVSVTIKTNREEKSGDNFLGVTSYGDVAFLENNNIVHLYLCQRTNSPSKATVLSKISTMNDASTCSVGEILALNVLLDDSVFVPFRSIRFDETSLCHSVKDVKINESRDNAVKEADSLLQKDGSEAKALQQ